MAPTPRTAGCEAGTPLAALRGIGKSFGGLKANDDVSLEIARGSILGLLGENGAGKTTAMNALAGLYLPDRGEILVDGKPLPPGSPRAAVAAGIGMIHQQFKLVDRLTGYENCLLARDVGPKRFKAAELDRLCRELGFGIDLSALVWQMTLAQRQQLEILRTLAVGARILVLDEPTSVLSPLETRQLFAIIQELAASGRAAVLISHKLQEVMGVATDIVVMRQGRVVHAGGALEKSADELARLIVGDRRIHAGRRATGPKSSAPTLDIENLTVQSEAGAAAVRDVSFTVAPGELVAILGVTGNGQSELMETIGGLRKPQSGRIRAPRRTTGGTAFIPSRHLGVALAPGLPFDDNAMLGLQQRPPFGRWLKPSAVAANAGQVKSAFGVAGSARGPVRKLSGGNLQRLVLGRELLHEPSLIVADYPTRGLDVAAAAQIREALVARAEAGAAVLLSSEELDETLTIASRVMVMSGGRIAGDFPAHSIDMDLLAGLMTASQPRA